MTKNFIEFIKEHKITIPLIQRDYAQGRAKERNKANNFLDSILDGTKNKLNLDFVYGRKDDVKKEFLPLDGQQRLTTLLLIHWFVSLNDNHIAELEKFDYDVRSSTKDFIKKLTSEKYWKEFSKKSIKKSIENANWFFISWKNDPTVIAILNMLDLIEKKFQKTTLEELNNITFEVLYLDDFKLTDELYVKMNARGKPLSEFENFKAKFEDLLIFDDKEYEQRIKAKLDNDWLNIFWNIAKTKVGQKDSNKTIEDAPKIADEMFYNFFYNFTLTLYLINKNKLECNINNNTKLFSIMYDEKKQTGFINQCSLFNFYEDVYNNEDNVKLLINVLNYISDNTNPITDELKVFISKKDITYWERSRFYALSLGYDNNLDNNEFARWERITFNLINNQNIDSSKIFIETLKSLNELSKKSNKNIYNYIQKEDISYFTKIQKEEERKKVNLIMEETKWETELVIAEKEDTLYLNGQIGFILDYSQDQKGNYDLSKFVKYRDKFMALWKFAEDNKENQILVYEALLTKGDYLPSSNGANYTFCSFNAESVRIRNDNWRKVFNSNKLSKTSDDYNPERTEYFKILLQDIDLNIDIKVNLENIIGQWLKHKSYDNMQSSKETYVYTLVSNNSNILYTGNNLQIRYSNPQKVYLLTRPTLRGKHCELYSYNLFTKYIEDINFLPFKNKEYYYSHSSEQPCIYFDKWLTKENHINYNFALDVAFENGEFVVKFFDRNENNIEQKYIINDFVYEVNQKKYIKKLKGIDPVKVRNEIQEILNQFNGIKS